MSTLTWKFSRNPCFAIIRWRPVDSFCCISVRPSPPYRDWVIKRNPPAKYDELVLESRFHDQCLLFEVTKEAACQTDESVTIEILNPEASPSSRDSPSAGVVAESQNAVTVRWGVPPPSAPVRAPPDFEADRPIQSPAESQVPVFSPKPAGVMPIIHVIHQAHVSDTLREQFSNASHLFVPRFDHGLSRRPHPRRSTHLSIEGPTRRPHPLDSRPNPPTNPPINLGPQNLPYRGIRFLYTVGGRELLSRRISPEASAPRSSPPSPPPNGTPDTNPDLRGDKCTFRWKSPNFAILGGGIWGL